MGSSLEGFLVHGENVCLKVGVRLIVVLTTTHVPQNAPRVVSHKFGCLKVDRALLGVP